MHWIKNYLTNVILLDNVDKAINVKKRASSYVIDGNDFYRVVKGRIALRCIDHIHSEALTVINELHEGICGNHSGDRLMAH